MSDASGSPRTRLAIITELYKLTCEMQERRANADFLVLSVEKRQTLIDEYEKNRLANAEPPPSPVDEAEMKRLVKEIISMNALITAALEEHKDAAKRDILLMQQNIANYQNHRRPAAGNRMDIKE